MSRPGGVLFHCMGGRTLGTSTEGAFRDALTGLDLAKVLTASGLSQRDRQLS